MWRVFFTFYIRGVLHDENLLLAAFREISGRKPIGPWFGGKNRVRRVRERREHKLYEVQVREDQDWLTKAVYWNKNYAAIYKEVLETAGNECRLMRDGVVVETL
jgi:hypothetical protein